MTLSTIMLNVYVVITIPFMLSVVMLSVVTLDIVMLSVVAQIISLAGGVGTVSSLFKHFL
jgi:hypothetical protein